MSTPQTLPVQHSPKVLDRVVIRFAGDSGDGMQLTGTQFTNTAAILGNDVSTLPDFPAEIRAPAGTLPGVSGFQLQFSSQDIDTPGDAADVLVAMNPAALSVNLGDLKPGGTVIVNVDAFTERDLAKAGYTVNPLENGSLGAYRVIKVELTRLTRAALRDTGLDTRAVDRCKNFFALGMMYYLYNRPTEVTEKWLDEKFKGKENLAHANKLALRAGIAFCEASEIFHETYSVPRARLAPGRYRNISGNEALALGMVVASTKAGRSLFLGSYPITPASDILHELARYKRFGVCTFQAEDEIAGVCAAIGASFGGSIGFTSTSGPGVALKTESIGLAVMLELPLVIANVQRGGPSTGLPTKTEQADLLQAMFGRNSEAPVPILAPATPGECFHMAYEAVRIAVRYMTPVFILSDGYLANGAEPWKIPDLSVLPEIPFLNPTDPAGFRPYTRDPRTLGRPWALPGTPGLEHRIGGLEKQEVTGNVSYDPANHERMVHLRAEKIERIAQDLPDLEVIGPSSGKLLLLGWGGTYGAIRAAFRRLQDEGAPVAMAHLRYLNPFPRNLGPVLAAYDRVLVPELNSGQLALLLRARFLKDVTSLSKIQGRPFTEGEVSARARDLLRRTA
jgi:2-oxoglutarate ferredoxin oxidoreductase subunit alpha